MWATTAASYCPTKAPELPKNNSKNLSARWDGKLCRDNKHKSDLSLCSAACSDQKRFGARQKGVAAVATAAAHTRQRMHDSGRHAHARLPRFTSGSLARIQTHAKFFYSSLTLFSKKMKLILVLLLLFSCDVIIIYHKSHNIWVFYALTAKISRRISLLATGFYIMQPLPPIF